MIGLVLILTGFLGLAAMIGHFGTVLAVSSIVMVTSFIAGLLDGGN